MTLKSTAKRYLAILLTIFSAIGLSAITPQAANAELGSSTTVTVHYQRFNADYTGWNVYFWKNDKGGADAGVKGFDFTGEDAFGKVLTTTITETTGYANLGFIVRQSTPANEWAAKDVSVDRFITQYKSDGSAEIWLVQGDLGVYYSSPTVSKALIGATIDDFDIINIKANAKITAAASGDGGFTVRDSKNQAIPVTSVTTADGSASATEVALHLGSDLTIGESYTVSQTDFGSIAATVGKLLNSDTFNDLYFYEGNDLGATYSSAKTDFRVWAPTASAVKFLKYADANDNEPVETAMTKSVKGTWTTSLSGDQHGTIYNYKVTVGANTEVAVDPYVRSTTINGERGVVLDLARTNPTAWTPSAKPAFSGKATDAIFYELHVRDLSVDKNSGVTTAHKGKYLGLTEFGTTTPDGKTKTGMNHIKNLGVTHVQLLPIFDYASVDEMMPNQFNWGYDPQNYNVPEGSYSTNPSDPVARVSELKSAVQALHDNKLRVIMDVVYNHVSNVDTHSFQKIVPGYFFRTDESGGWANGTGVGNEVASERSMARKYIVDSIKYWATEYNLDGFRFDLMGIHDVQTMQEVRAALTAIDPSILIIGEGWNMGNALADNLKANQTNATALPGIGQFNDGIRDGLKGSVFNATDRGYASGKSSAVTQARSGIVGNISYSSTYGGSWGAIQPGQSVNYVEAHDNLTLFDKLSASMPSASATERARVFRLASSFAILAQGMPFVHAGQEFMRTKDGNENSYNAPDSTNNLRWADRAKNSTTVNYFKGLFALRQSHPAFRMSEASDIKANLKFIKAGGGATAYKLNGSAAGDSWKTIVVLHNPGRKAVTIALPAKGNWQISVMGTKAGVKTIKVLKNATKIKVGAQDTVVVHK